MAGAGNSTEPDYEAQRIVFVTGPSGAGRSTAINVLEDLGFEAIDNLPLSLLPRLLSGPAHDRPLVLGLDTRNRDFSADAVIESLTSLEGMVGVRPDLVYVDCRPDVLLQRFSETRRRHPLAPAGSPAEGIEREMDLLMPIRARADVLIDTSEMTPHELRSEIDRHFRAEGGSQMAISINSFSYKRGLPRGLDMVLDCRFLQNPHWEKSLRPLDGRAPEVAAFVADDPRFSDFHDKVLSLLETLLPAYSEEGKAHFSIGLGCTGGRHRSVACAEKLSRALVNGGWRVSIRHRELDRDPLEPRHS
ncbi:MAG: RNase adapter RapZ [Sediminimonas sp.]|uniref:RNase adapter RapZ n=1 Tax=Sediminimonas sp. TaxID=2823379 RepID=UPI002870249F|nr:RNase adapter RapZ [Sediminimonas sp.]MDR9485049.1 RNase adapter RapZ [Sediminimonas sp.]